MLYIQYKSPLTFFQIDILKDVFKIGEAQYEMYQGNHDISLNTMQQHIHYAAYFEIPREIKAFYSNF